MSALRLADKTERDDLGAFTARVVRLDQSALVRLQSRGDKVTAWAATPFDVLATRSVYGTCEPAELTVPAQALLTSLAVERGETVDPGPAAGLWGAELPPDDGWALVDHVPAAELERLTERGLALAREHAGPLGPPASLLDQTVLTVQDGAGPPVRIPMRCLFALSGMGFLGGADTGAGPGAGPAGEQPVVRVSATGSWLRIDARFGAVVRRRVTSLPLFTS
ncbi:hypothetical protein [Pseudonocardia dioxanivorans]|uniref:Uncharacterized protein n=1 Tax=Pseudonocardia dioxanivorans (strain ATCC 55486 / DSM 44775 / JCM 13855 / CB1190) TaxID=675635 RepID=F4D1N7_PSEUX|nr:hypothetical protein [Pseudonocardia dioxanivorans]AEA26949.1 hypothetical protein Psed_4803 [Pseudonocardia dioxanivorans CB1190]